MPLGVPNIMTKIVCVRVLFAIYSIYNIRENLIFDIRDGCNTSKLATG